MLACDSLECWVGLYVHWIHWLSMLLLLLFSTWKCCGGLATASAHTSHRICTEYAMVQCKHPIDKTLAIGNGSGIQQQASTRVLWLPSQLQSNCCPFSAISVQPEEWILSRGYPNQMQLCDRHGQGPSPSLFGLFPEADVDQFPWSVRDTGLDWLIMEDVVPHKSS